jgi:hypothetical protein
VAQDQARRSAVRVEADDPVAQLGPRAVTISDEQCFYEAAHQLMAVSFFGSQMASRAHRKRAKKEPEDLG